MFKYELLEFPCQLCILLPNGCIFYSKVASNISLNALKELLFSQTKTHPYSSVIDWKKQYVFSGITSRSEEEVFYNPKSTISELGLVFPILKLISYESTVDKGFRENLFRCIGINSCEFDAALEESEEFQWAYQNYSMIALQNHTSLASDTLNATRYILEEPRYEKSNAYIMSLRKTLKLHSYISDLQYDHKKIIVELPINVTVIDTIKAIKKEKFKVDQIEDNRNFILKCCCSNSYMFDYTAKLIDHIYVQKCIEDGHPLQLSLMTQEDVLRYASFIGQEWNTFIEMPIRELHEEKGLSSMPDKSLLDFTDHFSIYLKNIVFLESNSIKKGISKSRESKGSTEMELTEHRNSFSTLTSPNRQRLFNNSIEEGSKVQMNESIDFEETSLEQPNQIPFSGSSSRLNSPSNPNIFYSIRVGLFNGTQTFIESKTSRQMTSSDHIVLNESLNFSITFNHLPSTTRINLVLLKIDRRSGCDIEYPLGWANFCLFDHLGYLKDYTMTLPLWDYVSHTEVKFLGLNTYGTTERNPNPRYVIGLTLRGMANGFRVKCPTKDEVLKMKQFQISEISNKTRKIPTSKNLISELRDVQNKRLKMNTPIDFDDHSSSKQKISDSDAKRIMRILKKDPLSRLNNEEKHVLWNNMNYCRDKHPSILPWLVDSVTWHDRTKVHAFYKVFNDWSNILPVEISLQLLGAVGLSSESSEQAASRFYSTSNDENGKIFSSILNNSTGGNLGLGGAADPWVREVAILSLDEKLKHFELSNYILQLVQMLKVEPYYYSPLGVFLLKRSLHSPKLIGLPFFWHLRSEMFDPKVRLKFGILLEAFCRGCGPLFHIIVNQINSLRTLETISTTIKKHSTEEEQLVKFKQLISVDSNKDLIQNFFNPLSIEQKFGEIEVTSCKIMHSKKKPLWLVWNNPDNLSIYHLRKYQIIYKHGDDLRQDMLTLQLLKVMDRIWKESGFDFCLSVYSCLSTGNMTGLIEAVRNARTIMSIQNESMKAAMQLDSSRLHRWLQTQTQSDPALYERAIHNFTYSCAGYSVATFVLGIRDRHNDNIMADEMGHLFHIDFGHFLDNRKKKFGINRERVPFVLPEDFVVVICKGREKAFRDQDFKRFIDLCIDAYRVLRKNSNLIITLLSMMLMAELPELYAVQHLDHVRRTLAVDKSNEKAEEYFRTILNEAYSSGWTTKVDWFGHWMNS